MLGATWTSLVVMSSLLWFLSGKDGETRELVSEAAFASVFAS